MLTQGRREKERMSGRERIMAALHGEPVDRIPFVPLIDLYTIMDMSPALVQEAHKLGYNRGMLMASRELGVDIMLRHVRATEPLRRNTTYLEFGGHYKSPVEGRSRLKDGLLVEELETPVGTLTATWGFTDKVSWIPHPLKHLVNNYEELKIYHYALDHLVELDVAKDHDHFRRIEQELGDEGIATVSTSNTPLMYLIEMVWGLENTYFLLHDYPEIVEDILEKLYRFQKRSVELVADSPADVVIQYENTSSTLLSPKMFRQYCLPCLNAYAKLLKEAGKLFLIHACGKLSSFVDDLAEGEFDGVADIAPPPTGDLPLDTAAASLGGKIVVGGVDATTFVNSDSKCVETQITGLIERVKPYSAVLLGSADTTPRGTPAENFRLIQDLVCTIGSYD